MADIGWRGEPPPAPGEGLAAAGAWLRRRLVDAGFSTSSSGALDHELRDDGFWLGIRERGHLWGEERADGPEDALYRIVSRGIRARAAGEPVISRYRVDPRREVHSRELEGRGARRAGVTP